MESKILRKNRGGSFVYTCEAIEKLAQFQNATENEKNGEKIENTAAKEQEIFTFSDGEKWV